MLAANEPAEMGGVDKAGVCGEARQIALTVGQTLGYPAHAQAGAMPRDCLTGMGREDPADVMRRVVQPFREVLQRERRLEREQLACVASEPLVRGPAVRRTLHPERLRDQRERPLLGSAVVAPAQRREQAAMLEVDRRARAEAHALSRQPRAVGEAVGQLDRGEAAPRSQGWAISCSSPGTRR